MSGEKYQDAPPPVSPIHEENDYSDDSDGSDLSYNIYASSHKNATIDADCNTTIYNSCTHVQRNFDNNTCSFCEQKYDKLHEKVTWLGCPVCEQWYHEKCFHY